MIAAIVRALKASVHLFIEEPCTGSNGVVLSAVILGSLFRHNRQGINELVGDILAERG